MASNSSAQVDEWCDLTGKVYLETEKTNAKYLVYLEESEAFADVLIYKEENELFADRPGIWFFHKNRELADFSIFLTKKSEALFSIYYIDSPTFTGCQ